MARPLRVGAIVLRTEPRTRVSALRASIPIAGARSRPSSQCGRHTPLTCPSTGQAATLAAACGRTRQSPPADPHLRAIFPVTPSSLRANHRQASRQACSPRTTGQPRSRWRPSLATRLYMVFDTTSSTAASLLDPSGTAAYASSPERYRARATPRSTPAATPAWIAYSKHQHRTPAHRLGYRSAHWRRGTPWSLHFLDPAGGQGPTSGRPDIPAMAAIASARPTVTSTSSLDFL